MKKNDIIELEITGLTSEGAGVGRCGGMAVFVPFTAPGDVIECRAVKVSKSYAYGRLERIISASDKRKAPGCEVYGRCGGCSLRHIKYEEELKAKEQFVADAFKRIGGLDVLLEPILYTGVTERYRNKAQLPVAECGGRAVCGFYSPRSHRVTACSDCMLEPKIFSEISGEIIKYQNDMGLPCYDEKTGSGLLRHIYLRRGSRSGEISVCLVVAENTKKYNRLAKMLAERFPDIKTVLLNINPERTNVILGEREVLLHGEGTISDEICGVKVELSPKSFYQVNTPAAELVYKKAAEYSGLSGRETLLDLYCGAGTVGLSMAGKIRRLIGVETVPEAVENARKNAAASGIENAEFIVGDAGKIAETLLKRGERPEVIIVDPPRKGCDQTALDAIAKMSPERIVMISCNPATAARDVKILFERGYIPQKACPADMFPGTQHVETVIKLVNSQR